MEGAWAPEEYIVCDKCLLSEEDLQCDENFEPEMGDEEMLYLRWQMENASLTARLSRPVGRRRSF
jgi:hypothetical protein